jgi:hypothetical protein
VPGKSSGAGGFLPVLLKPNSMRAAQLPPLSSSQPISWPLSQTPVRT